MTDIKSRALALFGKGRAAVKTGTAQAPATTGLGVFLSGAASVPAPAVAPARTIPVRAAKLVFAVDATGSRAVEWDAARRLTDVLFKALPGELDIALAVHGGGKLHTFTEFLSDGGKLRKIAARIQCLGGATRLLDILAHTLKIGGVGTVLYIGDSFEESAIKAVQLADALKEQGTRVIILFDRRGSEGFRDESTEDVFAAIAERTGGAVLPFDISALGKLRDLVAAVAVLAVGGVELLEAKQPAMPAATLLLEHLGAAKKLARK
jgi:hypothetical protein